MNPIRLTLKELETKTIPIGREGENDYTVVTIDCAEVFEKHPNAVATMRAQNYRKQIYPVTIVRDENDIVWTVKDSDLTVKGDGRIQLTFTEGTIIHKTVIGRTLVLKSLITNGPAPDPVQDWLDEAEEALEDLESAEVHQPIIGEDGYWYTWNQEEGEYQKTNTKAQGEGADVIDDTSTAVDKAWSASKVNGEITEVKGDISLISDLMIDEIPGTTKTVTFDNDNNPASITHAANGNTVRTDVFTWTSTTVTEVRTLASGKSITIVTNLETLEQTISDIEEVA